MGKRFEEMKKSEINWQIIYGCICKYWWIVALTTFFAMVLAFGVGNRQTISKRYRASAMIYVPRKGESTEAGNCVALVKSQFLLEALDEELDKKQMPILKEGGDVILCETLNNSDFISLKIEGREREREIYILNQLTKLFAKEAKEILDIDCRIVNDEEVKVVASENRSWRIIGVGLLLGCMILIVFMVFSDKIWSSLDVEKYFAQKYLGYFKKGNQDWIPLLQYHCNKNSIQHIFVLHSNIGKKGKKIFEQLMQTEEFVKISDIRQIEYGNIKEGAKAFIIIERGVDTYKEINQILMKLRWLDIETIGCICV